MSRREGGDKDEDENEILQATALHELLLLHSKVAQMSIGKALLVRTAVRPVYLSKAGNDPKNCRMSEAQAEFGAVEIAPP
jgi:hypothetical protein